MLAIFFPAPHPNCRRVLVRESQYASGMSNAFLALIWWVVPAAGLLGALGYVLWVTQFKDKYETETSRSVTQFQKFQGAFREAETVTYVSEGADDLGESIKPADMGIDQGRDK